jgi:hypothetical protein
MPPSPARYVAVIPASSGGERKRSAGGSNVLNRGARISKIK